MQSCQGRRFLARLVPPRFELLHSEGHRSCLGKGAGGGCDGDCVSPGRGAWIAHTAPSVASSTTTAAATAAACEGAGEACEQHQYSKHPSPAAPTHRNAKEQNTSQRRPSGSVAKNIGAMWINEGADGWRRGGDGECSGSGCCTCDGNWRRRAQSECGQILRAGRAARERRSQDDAPGETSAWGHCDCCCVRGDRAGIDRDGRCGDGECGRESNVVSRI